MVAIPPRYYTAPPVISQPSTRVLAEGECVMEKLAVLVAQQTELPAANWPKACLYLAILGFIAYCAVVLTIGWRDVISRKDWKNPNLTQLAGATGLLILIIVILGAACVSKLSVQY